MVERIDLSELLDEIDVVADEVIEAATEFTERQLKSKIPSNRVKTRKAFRSQSGESSGLVEIRFPSNKRYRSRGTETERLAKQAWRATQPATLEFIQKRFQENIEE